MAPQERTIKLSLQNYARLLFGIQEQGYRRIEEHSSLLLGRFTGMEIMETLRQLTV
jgi:hypothetical protein